MSRRWVRSVVLAGQVAAGAVALRELLTARRTQPPLQADVSASTDTGLATYAIVIPARNEAARLPGVLTALRDLPEHAGCVDVVVVDDESTDDTARVATELGARVVSAGERPAGWHGKPWALRVGLDAVEADWVVCLDADTVPDVGLPGALVARAQRDGLDFVTVGGRFDCPTPVARWLHPALLTTLVYRYGAPGQIPRPDPSRQLANGQCMAFRREAMITSGGFEHVAGDVVEDVALARYLARLGWTVEFLDAAELLTVRMFDDGADTVRGWGRSIALPGVEPVHRQLAQLAVVSAAMAAPPIGVVTSRTLLGRGINAVLLALRIGTLVGTREAYTRRGAAYWLSPAADPIAVGALAYNIARPYQQWRGRATRVR